MIARASNHKNLCSIEPFYDNCCANEVNFTICNLLGKARDLISRIYLLSFVYSLFYDTTLSLLHVIHTFSLFVFK